MITIIMRACTWHSTYFGIIMRPGLVVTVYACHVCTGVSVAMDKSSFMTLAEVVVDIAEVEDVVVV